MHLRISATETFHYLEALFGLSLKLLMSVSPHPVARPRRPMEDMRLAGRTSNRDSWNAKWVHFQSSRGVIRNECKRTRKRKPALNHRPCILQFCLVELQRFEPKLSAPSRYLKVLSSASHGGHEAGWENFQSCWRVSQDECKGFHLWEGMISASSVPLTCQRLRRLCPSAVMQEPR